MFFFFFLSDLLFVLLLSEHPSRSFMQIWNYDLKMLRENLWESGKDFFLSLIMIFFNIINICRIFQFDLYFFSSSHSARTPLTHAVPLVDLAECPHEYGCLLRFYYPVPMKDFLDPYSAAVLQQWPFFQCVLLHTGRGAGKKTHMHK